MATCEPANHNQVWCVWRRLLFFFVFLILHGVRVRIRRTAAPCCATKVKRLLKHFTRNRFAIENLTASTRVAIKVFKFTAPSDPVSCQLQACFRPFLRFVDRPGILTGRSTTRWEHKGKQEGMDESELAHEQSQIFIIGRFYGSSKVHEKTVFFSKFRAKTLFSIFGELLSRKVAELVNTHSIEMLRRSDLFRKNTWSRKTSAIEKKLHNKKGKSRKYLARHLAAIFFSKHLKRNGPSREQFRVDFVVKYSICFESCCRFLRVQWVLFRVKHIKKEDELFVVNRRRAHIYINIAMYGIKLGKIMLS